jgi:methionyl-tRNA formyltransferase
VSSGPDQPAGGPARTVFLGSGAFAVPILEALLEAPEIQVVGVVSAPDRPAGRGERLRSVPVVELARGLGLPALQPLRLRHPDAVAAVAALHPDLGVLADYGQIVPPDVLAIPPKGILNVHPSLLPRHRGATPVPATILEGDEEAGVSIIRMDAGLDTGPIVAVTSWPLDGTETAPELERRAATTGAALLRTIVGPWLRGEIEARPQREEGVALTRPLRREAGRLDPRWPVRALERQVRALQPWPGSFVETPAGRLIAWRAGIDEESGERPEPGRLGRPGLAAADGWLVLHEVQLAGGKRMSWQELLRGRPALLGASVGG